jgi:MFS family permease
LSDIWDVDRRGKSMSIFGLAPFAGPSLGPIISGYIQVSGAVSWHEQRLPELTCQTWRWVFWATTIFAGACTLLVILGIPETYRELYRTRTRIDAEELAPKILAEKAKRLRKETGDQRWFAPCESTSLLRVQSNIASGETGSIFQSSCLQHIVQAFHHGSPGTNVGGYHSLHVCDIRDHVPPR